MKWFENFEFDSNWLFSVVLEYSLISYSVEAEKYGFESHES
jgi:hypothetical protein